MMKTTEGGDSQLMKKMEALDRQRTQGRENLEESATTSIKHFGVVIPIRLQGGGGAGIWHDLTGLLRSLVGACSPAASSPRNNRQQPSKNGDTKEERSTSNQRRRCTILAGIVETQVPPAVAGSVAQCDGEDTRVLKRLRDILRTARKSFRSCNVDFDIRTLHLPDEIHLDACIQNAFEMEPDLEYVLIGLRSSFRLEGVNLIDRLEKTLDEIPDDPEVRLVGIVDDSRPSTPGGVLLPRFHLEALEGRVLPPWISPKLSSLAEVVEFLFDVYYRLGAALLVRDVVVAPNGFKSPSILRRPREMPQWWTECANSVAEAIRRAANTTNLPLLTSLDIVVPSYRTPKEVIERIMDLPRPTASIALRIIVVCDNPTSHDAIRVFEDLEEEFKFDYAAKFRMHERNLGPGGARNSGLGECTGDYVLFLDDDVEPQPTLLYGYNRMIVQHPEAAGFIGHTALPLPTTPRTLGLMRSRVCFGWDFAFAPPKTTQLGWAITANLCVKRDPLLRFDCEFFPRGGGGEDVDFCLRLVKDKPVKLIPARLAAVRHPYWDDGEPRLQHFVCWARGDRALVETHPEFAFWNLPDAVETAAMGGLIGVPLAMAGRVKWSWVASWILAQPVGEVVYEIASAFFSTSSSLRDADRLNSILFTIRTGMYTAAISMCHELGRFWGHIDRGITFSSFGKHFNWYAYSEGWRQDFPQQERLRLLKRGLVRAFCVVLIARALQAVARTVQAIVLDSLILRLALRTPESMTAIRGLRPS